jgi:NADH-quinone oxidoreductase subunit A
MGGSDLHSYAPLLIHLLIAVVLASLLTGVSVLIGWRRPSRVKQEPYECGVPPTGDAREPFSVRFYLVAMVFILFDVEAIFLYPWAYVFRSLRWYGFADDLYRHPAGGLPVSLEKGRAGLAKITGARD